jgi:hypothetical protein
VICSGWMDVMVVFMATLLRWGFLRGTTFKMPGP